MVLFIILYFVGIVSNEKDIKPNKIKPSSEKNASNIQGINHLSINENLCDAKIHKLNTASESKDMDDLTTGKSTYVRNTDENTLINKTQNKTFPSGTNMQKKIHKLPKKRKDPITEDVTKDGPKEKSLRMMKNGEIVCSRPKKYKNDKSDTPANDNEKGSIALGEECFQWIISPWTTKKFMAKYWEKKPLYIQREDPNVYKHVFSCKNFDELMRNSDKPMNFGKV